MLKVYILRTMSATGQPKVFVTRCREALPLEKMVLLEKSCQVTYWRDNSVIPREDLMRSLEDKDALFCLLTDKIDQEVLAGAAQLKVVSTMSVGYDHLGNLFLRQKVYNRALSRLTGPETERSEGWLHSWSSHGRHC